MTGSNSTIRTVSAAQMERLARWAEKKPAIALMGEFSAGKSTLLNLLIGKSVLPTQITATQLPPIWMRYGEGEPYRMDIYGNRRSVDLNDISTIPVKKTRFIRVYSKAEFLKRCDLIDTPGISDPNIPAEVWMHAVGYANAILWCTHATQAWRESERSAWVSLPDRLKDKSLLLVTRSDKLATDIDRQKVDARLEREAAPLFRSRHFMSLLEAIHARDTGDTGDAWRQSGGKEFMAALDGVITDITAERGNMLFRYKSNGSNVQNFPGVVQPNRPVRDSGSRVPSFAPVRPARPIGKSPEERRERLPAAEADNIREQLGIEEKIEQPQQPDIATVPTITPVQNDIPEDVPAPKSSLNALRDAFSAPQPEPEIVPEQADDIREELGDDVASSDIQSENNIPSITPRNTFSFLQPDSEPEDQIGATETTDEEVIEETSAPEPEIQPEPVAPVSSFQYMDAPAADEMKEEPIAEVAAFNHPVTDDADDFRPDESLADELISNAEELSVADSSSVIEEFASPDISTPTSVEDTEAVEEYIEEEVAEHPLAVEPDVLEETEKYEVAEEDEQIPSEVWAEIVARGNIETVPQVLAAIQELLDRVDPEIPDTGSNTTPEGDEASKDGAPLPGGWSRLA
ncbi:dynamin family protein [Parasulfitobacter algicola]|uniref:Dynamin family protein n=1 Tax=Parasulfitobacter algicola TaxID=2614809 RepID=A0ABX2IWH8_9RHOB|nr:dynamin family protein [Sulfitobacter algicola]NSX56690.1 dynamin family protein [Sulfitobacter algicola]